MESFILAMQVVLPVFLLMLLGYFLRCKQIIQESSLIELNGALFRVFLPCSLMMNIASTDLTQSLDLVLYGLVVGGLLVAIGATMAIVHCIEQDKRKQASMVQSMTQGNFLLFGVPIIQAIYGETNLRAMALFIACIIPVGNVLSISIFQYYRGDAFDSKQLIMSLVHSPLMQGSVLGLLLAAFHIPLPTFLFSTFRQIASIATPLALIVLGGTMHAGYLAEHKSQLTMIALGKLVILPVVGVSLAIWMGIRGIELVTLLMVFGAPTAVASFSLAQAMDGDSELAAQGIVSTTLGSGITVCLFLVYFGSVGLLW